MCISILDEYGYNKKYIIWKTWRNPSSRALEPLGPAGGRQVTLPAPAPAPAPAEAEEVMDSVLCVKSHLEIDHLVGHSGFTGG